MEEENSKVPEFVDMRRTPDLPSPVTTTTSGMPSAPSSKASSVAGEMTGNLEDEDFLDDPSYVKVGNNTSGENLNDTNTSAIEGQTTPSDDTERSSFSILDGNSSFDSSTNFEAKDKPPLPVHSPDVDSNQPTTHTPPTAQKPESGSSLMNFFGMASTADDFLKSAPPPLTSIPAGSNDVNPSNQSRPSQLFQANPSQTMGGLTQSFAPPSGSMPTSIQNNPMTPPHVMPPSAFPQCNSHIAPSTSGIPNEMSNNPMVPPSVTPTSTYPQSGVGQIVSQTFDSNPSVPSLVEDSMMPPSINPLAPVSSKNMSPAYHSTMSTTPLTIGSHIPPSNFPPPSGQFEELSLSNKAPMPDHFSPSQPQSSTGMGYVMPPSISQHQQMPIQPHLPTFSNDPSALSGPQNVFNNLPAPGNSAPFVPPVYSPSPNSQNNTPQIFTPQQPTPTYDTSSQSFIGEHSSNHPAPMPGVPHQDAMISPQGYNTYVAPSSTISRSEYDLEDSQGSDTTSGFWNWLKMTVTSVNPQRIGQQLLHKTKVATDTVLTTLDPGMEEYLKPVINLAIDSRNQDIAQGLRQGFRSIFGHTVARGKDVSHGLPPLIIGLENGLAALEQKFSQLNQVDFEFSGGYAMLACEAVIVELMPQQWFCIFLLGLRDVANNIQLNSLSQPIAVPPTCVQSIIHYRDNYNQMTYHPTWDDIVYGYIQNTTDQDWCLVLSGIPKQALLTIAAQGLAASYKQCLNATREHNLGQQFIPPHN